MDVTLWEAMLDAELTPDALIDLGAAFAAPRDRRAQHPGDARRPRPGLLRRFLPAERRAALAPRVERVLRAGLTAAKTPSLKGSYPFGALRDIALTKPTLTWLTTIWKRETKVPGLTLAENDEIALAQELALREVPGWKQLLERQAARTKNPGPAGTTAVRAARAVVGIPAERGAFFESLGEAANRQHEPWVLDGLRSLHHPLRAEMSERYILPSLAMLADIQRTGDIFFPKRWMDATLSGHRTAAAARTVRTFVDALPASYPDRLRRIILSSADDLCRSARMK